VFYYVKTITISVIKDVTKQTFSVTLSIATCGGIGEGALHKDSSLRSE